MREKERRLQVAEGCRLVCICAVKDNATPGKGYRVLGLKAKAKAAKSFRTFGVGSESRTGHG